MPDLAGRTPIWTSPVQILPAWCLECGGEERCVSQFQCLARTSFSPCRTSRDFHPSQQKRGPNQAQFDFTSWCQECVAKHNRSCYSVLRENPHCRKAPSNNLGLGGSSGVQEIDLHTRKKNTQYHSTLNRFHSDRTAKPVHIRTEKSSNNFPTKSINRWWYNDAMVTKYPKYNQTNKICFQTASSLHGRKHIKTPPN